MDRGLEGEGSAALRAQAAFSSSHLYEQASQAHRWDAQKPEHISGDQWIEILGRDADQQRHPKLMHDITKLFLHYDDGSAQLNDEDKEMLEVAAIVHDWGKRASLNYETKTEDDLLIEQKLFSETYDTLVGPGDVKRKYIIEKAVFDRDTKLGNIFDAIERLSYIRTATIAFEAQQTTTDPVLASHLQWLAAGTASHHIIPLMEHAANYTPVRAYLEHISPAIDGIFTQVPPSIFTRHGQAQHEKSSGSTMQPQCGVMVFPHAKPASKSGEDFNLTEGLNGTGRLIEDYEKLHNITKACRTLGMKTVLTSGSFDLMHIGHMRYLHKAKQYGDILVVGVDSDSKIKQRKGPDRPIVDEVERTQMLSHTRGVDFITLKQPSDRKWELIKAIKPDVLIATAETYSAEEIAELEEKYCGRVVVLEPQATTSTSARIRGLHVGWANKILRPVLEEMQEGVLLPETKTDSMRSSVINPERLIAAHVPVIHRGYIELFSSSPDASIGVLDQEIVNQFDYLRKDIRALEPQESVELIRGIGRQAHLLSEQQLVEVAQQTELIMPADDISRQLIARHALQNVTLHPVFLRWDRTNTAANVEVIPDKTIEAADVNPSILQKLEQEAGESTNWWRHVSALIEKDGDIVASARNQTLPTDHTLYLDGDPRITAQRGQNIETSLDIHAESKLIAEIARTGTSLEGASLYVSTFPCPNCAKLIATSGIKECYFVEGYAMLDGHSVLKQADVSVIKINGSIDGDQSTLVLPYRKSN